jgi:hypothetical protein
MALRMVALNQPKNGNFFSRKVIPADMRDAYAQLYGTRREAQLRQGGRHSKAGSKTRHAEWTAEIETRIETLRAPRGSFPLRQQTGTSGFPMASCGHRSLLGHQAA